MVDSGAYFWGCGLSCDLRPEPPFDFYSVTEQGRLPIVEPRIRHLDIPKFYNRLDTHAKLKADHGYPDDDPPYWWKETPAIQGVGFSETLEHVMHAPEASVISGVLQPALWLGFAQIFFLGMDFSHEYADGSERNGHSEPYTSRSFNMAMAETKRLYPDVRVAAVDCDRGARPLLHDRYPIKGLDYITLDDALRKL